MTIADNILPKLSLVLIFFVQTRNELRFVFMLPVPYMYQLDISVLFIVDSEEELGKSIISSSQILTVIGIL
jgi:hypothetical protein